MRWLLDLLFPLRSDERLVRDAEIDEFLTKLSPRLVAAEETPVLALLSYGDPVVRAAIHEAKYRGNARAFALLAAALCEYLRDADLDLRRMCIVPVPLGALRRAERGWNQAEEIARRGASELSLRIEAEALMRTRETLSQVSLPREQRAENVRGAFRAAHVLDDRTYLVLDDVVTTGATLAAAAEALQAAGAKHVIPIALAH